MNQITYTNNLSICDLNINTTPPQHIIPLISANITAISNYNINVLI